MLATPAVPKRGKVEGMYKTFEGLDKLQQMVGEAYGVPMTSNCMVPRQGVLEILDDMRNAIPLEMDDAQDVLDHKDSIINEAQADADRMIVDAEAERDAILNDADSRARIAIEDAEQRAQQTVAHAEDHAERLVADARREFEQVTDRAASEAERLIAEGNASYQRSVDDGIAEQQRLISESEVVRKAEAEAKRIIESAHADSERLRQECDSYVDSTLAQFEETLTATLRTVSRDRAALRKGAGASGYHPESSSYRQVRDPR